MKRPLPLPALLLVCAVSVFPTLLQAEEPIEQPIVEPSERSELLGVSDLFEAQRHQVISVQTEMAPLTGGFGQFFDTPDGEPARGEGSGFIVDADGLAITNWHVVAGAESIQAITADGDAHTARLVGADPSTDIALIELDTPESLAAAQLGSTEEMSPGEWVVAIGNPFGLEQSVTVGVLSAMGRQIGVGPYDDFLQTDAAINPGNSGGPLYNLDGEVIGVNTAIIPFGGGIGFAVPIDTVNQILPALRDPGFVVRGYIGAGIQDMGPDLAETFGLTPQDGVLLRSVEPGGPADNANLREGDVITHIDAESVDESSQLLSRVAQLSPGQTTRVSYIRDGESSQADITIGERPDPQRGQVESMLAPERAEEPSRLGVVLRNVTAEMAHRHDLSHPRGVYVDRIDPGSPASGILHRGDIILRIGDREINAPDQVPPLLATQPRDEPVRMLVHREGEPHFVALRVNIRPN